MKKCKECGREEWGFLSVLNEDGYCPTCAIVYYKEKIKKLQEQLDIVIEQRNDIHIDKQVLQKQLHEANNLFLQIQNKLENEPEEGTMTETRIYELIDVYLTKWVGKDWWMKNE